MALGGEHKDVSLPRRAEARKSELMKGVAEVALGEREDPGGRDREDESRTIFGLKGCAGYFGHPFSNKPIFACFHHNTTKKCDMK
jgi:hypothetical protein